MCGPSFREDILEFGLFCMWHVPSRSRRFCLCFVLRHANACRYPLTHHHSRTSVSLIRLGLSHVECVCMCDARVRVTTNARTHNHTPLSYLFVAGSGDRKTVMRGTFLNKLALYSAVCFAGTHDSLGRPCILGLVTDLSQFVTDCRCIADLV